MYVFKNLFSLEYGGRTCLLASDGLLSQAAFVGWVTLAVVAGAWLPFLLLSGPCLKLHCAVCCACSAVPTSRCGFLPVTAVFPDVMRHGVLLCCQQLFPEGGRAADSLCHPENAFHLC